MFVIVIVIIVLVVVVVIIVVVITVAIVVLQLRPKNSGSSRSYRVPTALYLADNAPRAPQHIARPAARGSSPGAPRVAPSSRRRGTQSDPPLPKTVLALSSVCESSSCSRCHFHS